MKLQRRSADYAEGRPFPLVLFSPGLGNSPYDYSIELEDLASHGYIVAAVEPIHDSLAVVLSDRGVVPFDGDLWGHYPTCPKSIAL